MTLSLTKGECEYLRQQGRQNFDLVKGTWTDQLLWTLPHRAKWLLGQQPGKRNNHHIVDGTHLLAMRSAQAGFLEGNTSATRPWYRIGTPDKERGAFPAHREWLGKFTNRTLAVLGSSNFYLAAGEYYYDYLGAETGAHVIEELSTGLHFHTLVPGSYYIFNDNLGVANIMVREFTLTVKALVEKYGKKKNGNHDWSNFSDRVKNLYEKGNYSEKISVVNIMKPNPDFDPTKMVGGKNRQYVSVHYEMGGAQGHYYADGLEYGTTAQDFKEQGKYLRISYSKRKPFIVGRASAADNFEYGDIGPTRMAMGLIKSLNKKAIAKDVAIEKMLDPTTQGPASLKKSYVTTQARRHIPLDAAALQAGGMKTVYDIPNGIGTLVGDVEDMRRQIDKFYFADFLLFLSMNPKTRTATETNAIIQEQQMVLGPNLQALNWTYNMPVVEFVMDYVLDMDPYLEPPPEGLQGQFLNTEFISVFAQAQRAADLPMINQYVTQWVNLAQINPKAWDNINLDELNRVYEDRYYLPVGIANPQSKVDAIREQAMKQMQRQQMLENLPGVARGAKDINDMRQSNATAE